MSKPNRCEEISEMLDAYLDSECSDEEELAVQSHLKDCDECATYCAESSRLIADLQSLPKLQYKKEIDFSFLETSSECAQISELLSAYLDAELSKEERIKVDEHLQSCHKCAEELKSIQGLVQSLNNLPRLAPSFDIVEKIDLEKPSTFPHNCGSISEMLDAFHDKELDSAESSLVSSHIEGCSECKEKFEGISSLAAGLKSLPRLAPSHDIVDKIDFAGPAKTSTPPQLSVQREKRQSSKKTLWFGLGGAVAAAVVVLFSMSHNTTNVSNGNLASKPEQGSSTIEKAPVKAPEQKENNELAQSTPEPSTAIETKELQETPQTRETAIAEKPPSTGGVSSQEKPSLLAAERQTKPVTQPATNGENTLTELALIPDSSAASADALGIGTDEDGLYDIKI